MKDKRNIWVLFCWDSLGILDWLQVFETDDLEFCKQWFKENFHTFESFVYDDNELEWFEKVEGEHYELLCGTMRINYSLESLTIIGEGGE